MLWHEIQVQHVNKHARKASITVLTPQDIHIKDKITLEWMPTMHLTLHR